MIRRLLVAPVRAAGLLLLAALASAPARARAFGPCNVRHPIVGFYPDATTGSVPRNAVFVFAVNAEVSPELVWDEGAAWFEPAPGWGFAASQYDLRSLLTPGEHELALGLGNRQNVDPIEPDQVTVRFEVLDELAPSPDETSQARITRVTHYASEVNRLYNMATPEAVELARGAATDCTELVAPQKPWCIANLVEPGREGEYHVEFEVDGPAVGTVINGYFLPATCRSAFFAEVPSEIRVVTETGMGSATARTGELLSGPVDTLETRLAAAEPSGAACGFTRPASNAVGRASVWLVLLASACALRRRTR